MLEGLSTILPVVIHNTRAPHRNVTSGKSLCLIPNHSLRQAAHGARSHILRATFTQTEFILWFADTQPLRVFVDSAAAPSTLSVLSRDTNVYEEASELIVRSISRPCVSLRFVLFQALSIDPHLVEKGD